MWSSTLVPFSVVFLSFPQGWASWGPKRSAVLPPPEGSLCLLLDSLPMPPASPFLCMVCSLGIFGSSIFAFIKSLSLLFSEMLLHQVLDLLD